MKDLYSVNVSFDDGDNMGFEHDNNYGYTGDSLGGQKTGRYGYAGGASADDMDDYKLEAMREVSETVDNPVMADDVKREDDLDLKKEESFMNNDINDEKNVDESLYSGEMENNNNRLAKSICIGLALVGVFLVIFLIWKIKNKPVTSSETSAVDELAEVPEDKNSKDKSPKKDNSEWAVNTYSPEESALPEGEEQNEDGQEENSEEDDKEKDKKKDSEKTDSKTSGSNKSNSEKTDSKTSGSSSGSNSGSKTQSSSGSTSSSSGSTSSSSSSGSGITYDPNATNYVYNKLASSTSEGVVLHCFNWSYNTIKANLSNIANAGYTTVQTSPIQQPKDYNASWTDTNGQWWKLYQPVSFSVASNSWIGNKSELKALCAEADKYGIKVICDIVVNHLGNDNGNTGQLDDEVAVYESVIYGDYNSYFHSHYDLNDSSILNVVQGNMGMPDLNTGNSYVQERVSALLEECIECGVDGFRFDAAKHIETADDGSYASNFWNVILGNANSAASKKGIKLFNYGEVLGTPGSGRNITSYTKLGLRVTDSNTSSNILSGVKNANGGSAGSSSYSSSLAASNVVLWAESHDTYMDNSTKSVSQTVIDKAYAIDAARNDAVCLYLARPGSNMSVVGSTSYKSDAIKHVNFFHNYFAGASEYLSNKDKVVLVERYNSSKNGVMVVNLSGGSKDLKGFPVYKISDGDYFDKLTGTRIVVRSGKIAEGSVGSTGIAVIY